MFHHSRKSEAVIVNQPTTSQQKTQWLPDPSESVQLLTGFILQQFSKLQTEDDCVAQRKYAVIICINHPAAADANFILRIDNSHLQPRITSPKS